VNILKLKELIPKTFLNSSYFSFAEQLRILVEAWDEIFYPSSGSIFEAYDFYRKVDEFIGIGDYIESKYKDDLLQIVLGSFPSLTGFREDELSELADVKERLLIFLPFLRDYKGIRLGLDEKGRGIWNIFFELPFNFFFHKVYYPHIGDRAGGETINLGDGQVRWVIGEPIFEGFLPENSPWRAKTYLSYLAEFHLVGLLVEVGTDGSIVREVSYPGISMGEILSRFSYTWINWVLKQWRERLLPFWVKIIRTIIADVFYILNAEILMIDIIKQTVLRLVDEIVAISDISAPWLGKFSNFATSDVLTVNQLRFVTNLGISVFLIQGAGALFSELLGLLANMSITVLCWSGLMVSSSSWITRLYSLFSPSVVFQDFVFGYLSKLNSNLSLYTNFYYSIS
jgi:hypothetical protein